MADQATIQRPNKDQLDLRHPEWASNHGLWTFTRDHYTAAVLRPDLLTTYLKQKRQGETNPAFKERCDNADYTNHFGTVVDSLVGMLGQVDDDASRVWGATDEQTGTVLGLGDPKQEDTQAARLWRDCDGHGTSWLTFWSTVATELSLTHMGWLMVDPRAADEDPVVRYLEPGCVVNWRYEGERLVEVLILEAVDTRTTLWADPKPVQQFLHLTLEGWARYRVTDEAVQVSDVGTWDQQFEDDAGNAVLPVRQVILPVRRMVGYYLAKKANAIFNRESERDHLVRVANFPKLLVKGNETIYEEVVKALKAGNNVLQGDGHTFIAPDIASATLAGQVNESKARELYMTGFREYGDAARERTATEVKQDVAAGAGAYLTLLSRTLDQAETWALHILTQIESPTKPDLWFAAHVERSTAFAPSDPDAALDRMLVRTFGPNVPVPMGRTAQENAALEAAAYMGLNANPDQVKAAVAARGITDAMATTGLPFPAAVRAIGLAQVIAAMGLIDPKQVVKMADGSERSLLAVVLEEGDKLAQADDLARQREAQFFGNAPPPFGGPMNQDGADDDRAAA